MEAYNNLGLALTDQQNLPEAIDAFKKAIEFKRDFAGAYNNLGNALRAHGELPEAITALRMAIKLKPDYRLAYLNLGVTLLEQAQFTDALAELRRGQGQPSPPDGLPFAELIGQAERMARADAKLPGILSGEAQPADTAERIALAELCQRRKLYLASVRLYVEALAADPKLKSDFPLYNAACAAALAGCGKGNDAGDPPAEDRTRLRDQSLSWLRVELDRWRLKLEKDPKKFRPEVQKQMQHWQVDRDFDGVRDPEALAKLPQEETRQWQQLWKEVEALAQRAAESKEVPPAQRPLNTQKRTYQATIERQQTNSGR